MITKTTEYVINSDGRFERVDITRSPLAVTEETFASLGQSVGRTALNVFGIDGVGLCSLSVTNTHTYACIQLPNIQMRAPFKTVNGLMVPNFASKTDPIMQLSWQVPKAIRVYFIAELRFRERLYNISDIWIIAFDASGKSYRLPLSNLFNDCKLCAGEFERFHPTMAEAMDAALTQFQSSAWNADLWTSSENSQQMFRFKPTNNGFETVEPVVDWTTLCEKVAVPITKYAISAV